jgi:hypothetical protein
MGGKKKTPRREAPESWIGREVRLGPDFGGGPYVGTLEEVNDRGIVVRYVMMGAEGERPMFVPWQQVLWLYPVDEEADTAPQEAG